MSSNHMDLAQKKVVVVGLGATGISTALFAKNKGALVTVTDSAPENELQQAVETMRKHRIRTALGGHKPDVFADAQLVVISPGVPHTIEVLQRARQNGVPVIGEVELAGRFIRQPILAVTGTNGKTTTTRLVGEMLAKSGRSVFVGGNIGDPLIDYVQQKNEVDVVVAEISSFQLDTIETFRPHIGVLLNIAEDHLDRYPDLQAYARSKARLYENQQPDDVAVLNGSDLLTMEVTARIVSRKMMFAADDNESAAAEADAVVSDDGIAFCVPASRIGPRDGSVQSMAADHHRQKIASGQIGLPGRHNLENAAAAALAALAAGATWDGIRATLREFRGLAHRLEYVGSVDHVRYFNDSKATNVDAVMRALQCFRQPVILMMGGRNKQIGFDSMTHQIRQGVRHLVAFGEAREEIKAVFGGVVPVSMAATMDEAVNQARSAAANGDVVLLSPACTSFDMYESYAQRGDDFRRVVNQLNR